MLGVQRGWRVADIGCGNGVLACEAALMGAEVDAIDISPAMLALAEHPGQGPQGRDPDPVGGAIELSPTSPIPTISIVSEFTLHHLPDFWKAVALSRIYAALKPGANFYPARHRLRQHAGRRGARRRAVGRLQHQEPRFHRDSVITHMRDEYSTFGWVIERMLTDAGFTLVSVDYHAPLHGTYLLRKPKPGEQS